MNDTQKSDIAKELNEQNKRMLSISRSLDASKIGEIRAVMKINDTLINDLMGDRFAQSITLMIATELKKGGF